MKSLGKKLGLFAGVAAAATLLGACAAKTIPQDSLNAQGPVAHKEDFLFWLAIGISAVVFFVVEGLLVLIIVRFRHRRGKDGLPRQIEGNTRLEIGWTLIPVLLLIIVAVPSIAAIFSLSHRPVGPHVTVQVAGHQWWWEFRYPNQGFSTANQLYIPVGEPVYLEMSAVGQTSGGNPVGIPGVSPAPAVGDAVIHGFWVPELAGKTDVIPGRTNTMTIEAYRAGTYDGQCSAFCGFSHANMHFQVIAVSQADFQTWVQEQQSKAMMPQSGSVAAAGLQDLTTGQCIACHSIQGLSTASGTPVLGVGGPDLTHFASRSCFAGCSFPNTPANVAAWLQDPQSVKPGALMPNLPLSQQQIQQLVAYLEGLK